MRASADRLYQQFPEHVSGYELDPEHGYFSVIIPEETRNLVTNPSFETGLTTGYAATAGAAIVATLDWQAFGVWGLKVTPATGAESGAYYGTITLAAGSTYTASAVIQGEAGVDYHIYFATSAGALVGTKRTWTGTGHKQRIHVTYAESAALARRVYVVREARDGTVPFYMDALQVEAKAYPTTFCDGDQLGFVPGEVAYRWTGLARASISVRSAQTKSGGREMNLRDLGLRVLAVLGLGMAPMLDQSLLMPGRGSLYQGTGTASREFTLVAALMADGTSGRHLQAQRAALVDAFKPDSTAFDQPLILRYQACDEDGIPNSDTLDLVCTYQSGLEGEWNSQQDERLVLSFKMHLPLILDTYSAAVELGYQQEITDANLVVRRDPDGRWGNLSADFSGAAYAIVRGLDGCIYIGGTFTNVGDANGDGIVKYDPTTGAISSLGTGVDDGGVTALAVAPNGDIYVGGSFTGVGGVVGTARIALWDGSWHQIGAGGDIDDGQVNTLVFDPDGLLYAGGTFSIAGGFVADRIAMWDGVTWNEVGNGVAGGVSPAVNAIVISPTGEIIAGGSFTSAGGNLVNNLAKWTGSIWRALSFYQEAPNGAVTTLAYGFDGLLYIGGYFTQFISPVSARTITASKIASFNGTIFRPLGSTLILHLPPPATSYVQEILPLPDGTLLVMGYFNSLTGLSTNDGVAIWNGSVWFPLDIDLPGDPAVYAGLLDTIEGSMYLLFNGTGTAYSSDVDVQNVGSAGASPTFWFVGPGTPTLITNMTTKQRIAFEGLNLQNGETAALRLDQGRISFVSNYRGNLLPYVVPGSDLDMRLIPGVNTIALLLYGTTTPGTSAVYMSWRNLYWGLDGAVMR